MIALTALLMGIVSPNSLKAAAGDLSPTFTPALDGAVSSSAIQPDGKILIGGSFTTVGRSYNRITILSASGADDTAFAPNVNGNIRATAVQSDGKFIIAGDFTSVGGVTRNRIARLNTNGTLDTGFAPSINGSVYTLGIQSNGQIVVGGQFTTVSSITRTNLVRLNTDGSVDTAYFPSTSARVLTIAIQANDKAMIGGEFTTVNSTTRNHIARLNIDGTLDTFAFSTNHYVTSIAVQADGKIVVGGSFTAVGNSTTRMGLARVAENGTLDTDFDANVFGGVYCVKIQSDNKILIGGYFTTVGGVSRRGVARLETTGALDATFNSNAQGGAVSSLSVQADGHVLIGGSFTTVGGVPRSYIARLDAVTGALDTSFTPTLNKMAECVTILADTRVLIAGDFTTVNPAQRNRIARLNTDGTVDADFDPNSNGTVSHIAVQADGKIVLGGTFTEVAGTPNYALTRINADGTKDTGFYASPNANKQIAAVAIQADGKILVGGTFTVFGDVSRSYLARLNTDGSLDIDFTPSLDDYVYGIALQPDGKIIIGGVFRNVDGFSRASLARLNSDGTLDTGFTPTAGSYPRGLAVQADGNIVVVGSFTNFGGPPRNYMARVAAADGALDAYFAPTPDSLSNSVILQADGKVIMGGPFGYIQSSPRNRIGRVNSAGTLDATFNPNLNQAPLTVIQQADGQVLIGGQFTTVGTTEQPYFARLQNDAATESLIIDRSNRVVWLRGGSAPEAQWVTFELSTDGGTNYLPLGQGSRITGGWQLSGLTLPLNGMLRARASLVATGGYVSSSSLIQSVASYTLPATPELAVEQPELTRLTSGGTAINCGTRKVAEAGVPVPFTIRNSGRVDLVLGTITKDGSHPGDFAVSTPGITTLAPGGITTFTVTLTPTAVGARSAVIHVASNDTAENPFNITVNGTGVNNAPTISDVANVVTDEDTPTAAIPFTIGDVETALNSLTLTRTSTNTSLIPLSNIVFGGSGANRTITLTPVANQSGTSSITITVNDGTTTSSDTILFTVNAVNDPPTISDISTKSALEDSSGAGPFTFTVNDIDTPVGSLTLSASSANQTLIPDSGVMFGGSGSNRTFTLTPTANQSGTCNITVIVSDGNLTASDTFEFTSIEVNDPPTISDLANITVDEDVSTGPLNFTVGDIETPAASLLVTASSNNSTLVPISSLVVSGNGAARTLTVTPAANKFGTATITVSVKDADNTTVSDTFLLTVTTVNDPPTVTDIADQTINEDEPTTVLGFTIGDVETSTTSLTVTRSSSNPTLVPDTGIVLGGSGASRTVRVTPAANQFGSAIVTVSVSDGTHTTSDTFLVTVNAINDPPTISDIANRTIQEDASTGPLAFTVGDVETPLDSLIITATSSNQNLVSDASIVFGGTGASRTVTVQPAPEAIGSTTITITVNDGTATATDTILLTVTLVSDTPTISDIATQTIDEDTPTQALSFTVTDPDTAIGSVVVSASSNNPNLVRQAGIAIGGSGTNRTITVTPLANASGTTTITVSASDGNTTHTRSFVVNVTAVNDPPVLTLIEDQTLPRNSTGSVFFLATDVDNTLTQASFSVSSSNIVLLPDHHILFTQNYNGWSRIDFAPATNQIGTTTITLTVTDGTSTAIDTFELVVLAPRMVVKEADVTVADGSLIDFGNVGIGNGFVTRTFTIHNTGNTPLSGLTVTKTGTHQSMFTMPILPSAPVLPGESTTLNVRALPSSSGLKSAVLHLLSNDPDIDSFDLIVTAFGVPAAPPAVTTLPATNISYTSASLMGKVNAKGSERVTFFDYGTTASYGTTIAATPGALTGNTITNVSAPISGLLPHTKYYYRVRAAGATGSASGQSATFVTTNHAPVGTSDAFLALPSSPLVMPVLDNDSDADGDILSIHSFTSLAPSVGKLAKVGTSLVFTPSATFGGNASFSYVASDRFGGKSSSVTVTLGLGDCTLGADVVIASDSPPYDLAVTATAPFAVVESLSWLTFVAPAPGDDHVRLIPAPNPSLNARTGTIKVGGKTHSITQQGISSVPVLTPPSPIPNAAISAFYDLAVPTQFGPVTYTAIGLPKGLTLSNTTGRITGRPSVPGTSTVVVQAKNAKGSSSPVAFNITVLQFPLSLAGNYSASIPEDAVVTDYLGGLLTLSVTNVGTVSGTLKIGAGSHSFNGQLNTALNPLAPDPEHAQLKMNITRTGKPAVELTVDMNSGGVGLITGSIRILGVAHIPAPFAGGKHVWHTTSNPADAYDGKYTTILSSLDGSATIPQGQGFLTFTVTKAGAVTWSGELADGTIMKPTSATLLEDGTFPVFMPLYASKGSLNRILAIAPHARNVSGGLSWCKKLQPASVRAYAAGFGPPTTLQATGSVYVSPSAGQTMLNIYTPPGTARISFDLGGIEDVAQFNSLVQLFSINTKHVATFHSATAGNPANVKITKLDVAKGTFAGTFTLTSLNPFNSALPTVARKVNFSGVLVPSQGFGTGYFLLPAISGPPANVKTSPMTSGRVTILP